MWAVARARRQGYLAYFVHKVDEVNVKWVVAEMFANHLEDRALQNKRVVHGLKADALYVIPARLATPGDARIHDVVRNE
jgi:DNA primase